jgi:serralysin
VGKGFFPTPTSPGYPGQQGDIFLNIHSQANFLSSYEPGSAGWFMFMHEIGHTLGLKHPHDDGGTGHPTLGQIGLASLNTDWATVMSYADDYAWNLISWDPATPMILDVLALQYLYGPNMQSNLGDSTHTLTRSGYYLTLWDAGGNDTMDASSATDGWLIALPDIQPSTVVSTKVGIALPYSDTLLSSPTTLEWLAGDIENAIGSAYADFFIGSGANNSFRGNLGNDSIDGGGGVDTAYYSGSPANYTILRNTDGTITLSGADGSDTLLNIERLVIGVTQIAIDIDGNAGKAYRLYQAAFDRKPDIGGLGYQMHDLDLGYTLAQVAANFIASPEFQSKYGNVSDSAFVTLLYQHVLHRTPQQFEVDFHVNQELHAGYSRAQELTFFSESPENQANVLGDIQSGMVYVW